MIPIAEATPPATTWIGVMDGYLGGIIALLIICCLILTVGSCVMLTTWTEHRQKIANARADEEAVRNRLITECGQWCPKCGTATSLRNLKGKHD